MTAVSRLMISLSLAGVLLGAAPGASRAEEPAVVKMLLDSMAAGTNIRPTYKSVDEAADGTITVKGLQYAVDSNALGTQSKTPQFNVQYEAESLTLQGVSEVAGKGFEIAHGEYGGLTIKYDGELLAAVPEISMSGIYLGAVPDHPTLMQRTLGRSTVAKETDVPQVVIVLAGKSLTIENTRSTFDGDPWTRSGTQHFTVGRVAIPQEILAMGGEEMPFKQLGYTSLEFSSDSTVKLNFSGENMSLAFDLGLAGKDMGTLHIAASIADIPFALIEAGLQGKDNADPDKLMALANGVAVSDLRVSFSDSSLTNRLIDFFAASQKMDRAQIIASAAASIQLGLVDLKNQDFSNKVIAAVSGFLTTPGSLSVIAAMAPVTVQQMVQSSNDPAALLKLLQLDVQANQ